MIKNIGSKDKKVRIVVAILLAMLYVAGFVSGALGVVVLVLAVVLMVTAFTGFCGLYKLIGVNTCPVQSAIPESNPTPITENPVEVTESK